MLPKKRRIQRSMFTEILSKGRRVNSPHLLLYIFPIKESLPSHFAFSISKKICKKAVDRNKYRRQGYSIISKHITEVVPGFLFFFSFKRGLYPISFDDLEKEILSILQINKSC